MFSVHVLYPGLPIGTAVLGGLGSPNDPGPVPGCFQVFISSDCEHMFGQQCTCGGYWRSSAPSHFCAYCGIAGEPHNFLTDAHRAFIQQFSELFMRAVNSAEDGDYVIDLNAVADAAESTEKPAFYYAEQSQQNKFTCRECGCKVDILGTFGYCSLCGTRNDVQELEARMTEVREQVNTRAQYEACVRDSVAIFDSFAGQYINELVRRVPLTVARKNRLQNSRVHSLDTVIEDLKSVFDIDIQNGIDGKDRKFAALMFFRRHVYEHKGGEADSLYIEQSGDHTVKVKQALWETQESAHRIVNLIVRMARNLHNGYHDLFAPDEHAISRHQGRNAHTAPS